MNLRHLLIYGYTRAPESACDGSCGGKCRECGEYAAEMAEHRADALLDEILAREADDAR